MNEKEACRILGVKEGADKAEITRRYEILLKKNKAAMIEGKTDQDLADIKEIDKAYNLLMGYDTADMVEEYELKENKLLNKAGISEKKLRNFFYYYKLHIIFGLFIAVVLGIIIKDFVTNTKPDLYLTFAGNLFYSSSESIEQKIKKDIPEIKNPVVDSALSSRNSAFITEYNADMKLTALLSAGDVDVFILDRLTFERLGKQGFLINLDGYIEKYGLDMDINGKNMLKARKDSEEHLYGIDVTGHEFFKDLNILGDEKIVAISIWAKEKPNAHKFVEYLAANNRMQ